MDKIKVKNIFAAINNKSFLDSLLAILDPESANFWGTEGTVKYLKSKGFAAQSVVLGFDFDGRLKSISREIFARILADRSKKSHLEELRKQGPTLSRATTGSDPVFTEPIDLVTVDLYAPDKNNFPESMDIGGQALIRAAIKNYKNVALAFDKESIGALVDHLKTNQGSTLLRFRKNQAKKASRFIAERCKLEADLF